MKIIAGLQKHIEQPALEGSLVVVILNLKAAKLAGELSEG
jgi:tRNA-binding EMAP/Myf-like protein